MRRPFRRPTPAQRGGGLRGAEGCAEGGEVAGFGTASGVRVVLGMWQRTPLGSFADGWTVTNRFRFSDVSGRFISNFPGSVDTAAATATALGGAGATARYFNGPNAGQAVAADQLLASIVVFDVKLVSVK